MIKIALQELWKNRINENQLKFNIQFKIKYDETEIRSISYLQQNISSKDFDQLLDIFQEFWNVKSDYYHHLLIEKIIFSYSFIPKDYNPKDKLNNFLKHKDFNKSKPFNFKGNDLPTNMDITSWGKVVYDKNLATIYKNDSKVVYQVKKLNGKNEVKYTLHDKVLFTFLDSYISYNKFERILNNNHIYIIENNNIVLKKIKRKVSFMKPAVKSMTISDHFITMDLETRTIDGVMSVIAISIFDGNDIKSFYITEYINSDKLLEASLRYIMIRKYNGYKIYLHNFSKFDGVFMLKILSNLSTKIKPIIRDNNIIDIIFHYGKNNMYKLYFRDSLLLLPSSLRKLGVNFSVDVKKSYFPYNFINNENIPLNYKGEVPSIDYFDITPPKDDSFTVDDYNKYCNEFKTKQWDLKNELVKYCETDVISLWQIIRKFQENIFIKFEIDVLSTPTLSSLALTIYRSCYLKDSKIPIITGKLYNELKKSYSGGSVDLYKPYGKNIYRYDVNSLYPYVMKKFPMPVGTPYYFEGNILDIDKDAFGFFNVKVTSPKDIKNPILQTKINTGKGFSTVCPLGNWTGMYFSEEIKNAMKYGYKFKVISGYLFKKRYIFNGYVDDLYKIKSNSDKNSPDYIISKLLLNSLYGRFGMDPEKENHEIIEESESLEFYNNKSVRNVMSFGNGKELISYLEKHNNEIEKDKATNISVAISSAVTAYSRIHMSNFKNLDNITLYYTDTDSVDFDKPLSEDLIGKQLGKLKLENVFKEAVYLAPKVYGAIIIKNKKYKEYVRVKGLKNPVMYNELLPLLNKDYKISVKNEKWYKSWKKANIIIKDDIYTLMATENKRKFVYDNNNKIIDTVPLKVENGIIL